MKRYEKVTGDEPKPQVGDKITVNGRIFDVKDKGTVSDPEYVTLRMAYDAMAFGVSLWRENDGYCAQFLDIEDGYQRSEMLTEKEGVTTARTEVLDPDGMRVYEVDAVDLPWPMVAGFNRIFNEALEEGIKEGRARKLTEIHVALGIGGSRG